MSTIPLTSFPGIPPDLLHPIPLPSSTTSTTPTQPQSPDLLTKLQPLLVNSDSLECNNSISCFIKESVEGLYGLSLDICTSLEYPSDDSASSTPSLTPNPGDTPPSKMNYLDISKFALRLIKLNMFSKNLDISVGKILGLLSALSDQVYEPLAAIDPKLLYETNCLKEFLCITILLLVKTQPDTIPDISSNETFQLLKEMNFASIMFKFLDSTIHEADETNSNPYILVKFGCDIIFEYLYRIEIFSDQELAALSQTNLIENLISHLLLNDNFNNYDMDDDEDWQDEGKVMAFEQFKLLLLLNEQYLMKSYSNRDLENKVFSYLLTSVETMGRSRNNSNSSLNLSSVSNSSPGSVSSNSSSKVAQFMNMTICYLNREESHIIKTLILKFLYLVFTTSFITKQFYLNDLKILIDIFIRELDNLDYSNPRVATESRLLGMAFLKVLYPLLVFSQLSEISEGYKNEQIIDLLQSLILNSEDQADGTEEAAVISQLASKCLKVPWLKRQKHDEKNSSIGPYSGSLPSSANSSTTSLSKTTSLSSSNPLKNRPELYHRNENPSQESLGAQFTRLVSVRSSTTKDFHKSTDKHNLKLRSDMVMANNKNYFLNSETMKNISSLRHNSQDNILNLPQEYIERPSAANQNKPTRSKRPPPPPPTGMNSLLSEKPTPFFGLRRPAQYDKPLPIPPPPPPRRRKAT